MAQTYLGYPFDAELFIQSWKEAPDPAKSAMLTSGALVDDALIAERIGLDGNLYTIPFYDVLSGDPGNYDGATDVPTSETVGGAQTGVVFGRTKGFTARNFAAELSGSDPMGHIAASVARYWSKYRQSVLLKLLEAVFGVTGAAGTNAKAWHDAHTADVCSTTASPRNIEATDLNNLATQALGDNKTLMSLVIMHSNVAKTLENLQLLEYWKYTDANGVQRPMNLGSVSGYTVIIDDGVPVTPVGGSGENKGLMKYTTYLLGAGVLRTAQGRVDVPSETVREPLINGGQDTLVTRIRETIHPNGFSFSPPSSGWTQSPTDEQLRAAANWSIVYNHKSIPMARLVTNG